MHYILRNARVFPIFCHLVNMARILSLRLDNETYQKLKEFCKEKNITASDLVRGVIHSILSGSQTIQIIVGSRCDSKNLSSIDFSEIYIFRLKSLLERFSLFLKKSGLEISPEYFKSSSILASLYSDKFIKELTKKGLLRKEKLEDLEKIYEVAKNVENVLVEFLKEIEKIISPELLALNNALESQNYNSVVEILTKIEDNNFKNELFQKSQHLIEKYVPILKEKLENKVIESEIKEFLSEVSRNYIGSSLKFLKNKIFENLRHYKKELNDFLKETFEISKKLPTEYLETAKSLIKFQITILEKIKKMEIEENKEIKLF